VISIDCIDQIIQQVCWHISMEYRQSILLLISNHTLEKHKNINLAIEEDRTKDIRWKISEVGKQYLASHN